MLTASIPSILISQEGSPGLPQARDYILAQIAALEEKAGPDLRYQIKGGITVEDVNNRRPSELRDTRVQGSFAQTFQNVAVL